MFAAESSDGMRSLHGVMVNTIQSHRYSKTRRSTVVT